MENKVQESRQKFQENLLHSFGFSENNLESKEADNLEKGIVSYSITDSKTFSIQKSGKLIKEKLQGIKSIVSQKLVETQIKFQNLRQTVECEPDRECENYGDTLINLRIGELPKIYSWELIDSVRGMGQEGPSLGDSTFPKVSKPSESQQSVLMKNYNDLVYQFKDFKKDMVMIETMLENFQDNKSYDLSVEQAALFGF